MDGNYYMWASIVFSTLAGIFAWKATQISSQRIERKVNQNLEVSKQSSEVLESLSGAGSTPLAQIWDYGQNMEEIRLNVQLLGEHTLKDVEVWVDVIHDYRATDYSIDIRPFTLPAIQSKPLLRFDRLINGSTETNIISIPLQSEEFCIVLYFQADSESWAQYIYRTKKNDRWVGMSLLVNSDRKVVYKRKNPNYPMIGAFVQLNKYALFEYDSLDGREIQFYKPDSLLN